MKLPRILSIAALVTMVSTGWGAITYDETADLTAKITSDYVAWIKVNRKPAEGISAIITL